MSKRKTKRELLLEAGLDLFCEKGFEKTTIDDIIARADCGKGTFYRYFDNKDSLYSELLAAARDAGCDRRSPACQRDDEIERFRAVYFEDR